MDLWSSGLRHDNATARTIFLSAQGASSFCDVFQLQCQIRVGEPPRGVVWYKMEFLDASWKRCEMFKDTYHEYTRCHDYPAHFPVIECPVINSLVSQHGPYVILEAVEAINPSEGDRNGDSGNHWDPARGVAVNEGNPIRPGLYHKEKQLKDYNLILA